MPNEQTSVPLFTAGEVLTAANMNISAGTGVPVFATTVTRDAAFGGAGEKLLAEGQLCYLSSTNVVQYYDGAAWATVGPSTAGGLVAVVPTSVAVGSGTGTVSATGTVTFTGASSVSVNGCFSATYTNYLVLINWFTATSVDPTLRWRVGGVDNSTASSYVCNVASTGATSWQVQTDTASSATFSYSSGSASTAKTETLLYIYEPFLAVQTRHNQNNAGTLSYGQQQIVGKHNQSTSYDGFSILSSSNLTGTLTVYGYSL